MTSIFLESPKYILIFLGLIDFILIFSLKQIPFDKKKFIIIIISILIPSIYLLSAFIETDNEKIEKILKTISKTSNTLQIDSITKFLDKNFVGEFDTNNYNKEEFITLLKEKVGKKTINAINLEKKKISFFNDRAKSSIISHVDLTTTEGVFRLSLIWEITWIKKGESWFLLKTKTPKHYLPFKGQR